MFEQQKINKGTFKHYINHLIAINNIAVDNIKIKLFNLTEYT